MLNLFLNSSRISGLLRIFSKWSFPIVPEVTSLARILESSDLRIPHLGGIRQMRRSLGSPFLTAWLTILPCFLLAIRCSVRLVYVFLEIPTALGKWVVGWQLALFLVVIGMYTFRGIGALRSGQVGSIRAQPGEEALYHPYNPFAASSDLNTPGSDRKPESTHRPDQRWSKPWPCARRSVL